MCSRFRSPGSDAVHVKEKFILIPLCQPFVHQLKVSSFSRDAFPKNFTQYKTTIFLSGACKSMSPHYSRLPRDRTTEQQDPGRQHDLPEPHAVTGLPGETAAFWLPGKQSCLVCGVEGFQTFTSACLALLLIMIHWWVPLLCTEPRSNLPFHYLLLFQNKKVKVWTWNTCASHEAIEKAREWGPRLAFLLLFQQTFQVRLMLLVTAQAAWVTQFSDPFLLPLHLPVPTVFMVFPIRLWEICFSFYLGRLSSAQWVPGRHLGAETWNLPASGWAAMGSMTHSDSMHSWAAFLGDQWLGHCRCPTSECPHSSSPPRCPCVFWSIPSQGEQEDYSIFYYSWLPLLN